MELEKFKEIQFQNALVGTLCATDCHGVMKLFGIHETFELDIETCNHENFKLQFMKTNFKKIRKCFDNEKMFIDFTVTPKNIIKVKHVIGSKGYVFQISKNPDESKLQIYFNNLSEDDLKYLDAFFWPNDSGNHVEDKKDDDVEEIKENMMKYSPLTSNSTLIKNRKKKIVIGEDDSDKSEDYVPLKRQRKQSFSQIPTNSNTILIEDPPKRNLRNRNRDEINLCEDLTEEAQLEEALKRSLKGIDQNTIDLVNEFKTPEVEQEDLFENVDKTLELFSQNATSGNVVIRMEDYICLSRNEYLSGVIIDFYLDFIYKFKMTPQQREMTYIFGTPFYSLYSLSSEYSGWNDEENAGLNAKEKRYKRIEGLLDPNINIFEKDFLVFPLMDSNHWFLAIVCYPKLNGSYTADGSKVESDDSKRAQKKIQEPIVKSSCILIFDSIKGNGSRRTVAINHIKNFLEFEWMNRYRSEFPFDIKSIQGHSPKVPLQSNNVDCGCFILEFMERFFVTSPISDYRFPMDLSGWFSSESVKREKRREIAGVIQYKVESTGIELPKLRYYGDSQMNTLVEKVDSLSTFEETQNDNGNGNNNDENFNNNNDFNCLNSNSTECVEILPSLEQQNSLTVEISEETIEDNHNLIDDISFDDNIMHDLASDSMLLVEKVLDFVDEMNVLEKACKNYDYINEFKTDNDINQDKFNEHEKSCEVPKELAKNQNRTEITSVIGSEKIEMVKMNAGKVEQMDVDGNHFDQSEQKEIASENKNCDKNAELMTDDEDQVDSSNIQEERTISQSIKCTKNLGIQIE